MPQKVSGFLYYQRQGGEQYGDPDSMTVLLHYQEGLLVTLKASVMNAEPAQLRYWVRGEKGVYKKVSSLTPSHALLSFVRNFEFMSPCAQ